jgi:hypothetical protein
MLRLLLLVGAATRAVALSSSSSPMRQRLACVRAQESDVSDVSEAIAETTEQEVCSTEEPTRGSRNPGEA